VDLIYAVASPTLRLGTTPVFKFDYSRDLRLAKWGSGVSLQGSNPKPLMSALGQKQTPRPKNSMSALPPKADIAGRHLDVRFVHAERLCGFEIDD
jgi:hypothetical protein